MEETDPVTLALTGQLPFVLIVGALLALPLSLSLLSLYRRAVLRGMRTSGGKQPRPPADSRSAVGEHAVSAPLNIVMIPSTAAATEAPNALMGILTRAPRRTALLYGAGGLCYAAVMAAATLVSDAAFSPLRFIVMLCIYAWPIVFAINLIVPSTMRVKAGSAGGYFAALTAAFSIAVAMSTEVTLGSLYVAWSIFNLPATALLLFFLNRRTRAVGPLVVTFTLLSMTGATVMLDLLASSDDVLSSAVGVAGAVGLGAVSTLVATILIGLVVFGVLGWFATKWIRGLYLSKRLSDQSLTLDAMWLLFGVAQSIALAFAAAWWIVSGLVAFVAYKLALAAAFRAAHARPEPRRTRADLLYLRVFALGRRSEQSFDAVAKRWRYVGNVRLIAGPDLAIATVEPHEFLEYLSGRIDRAFIADEKALADRTGGLDLERDFDGRYRVHDFFCYDDTWTIVLSRLVKESQAVFMDVRGFTAANSGVVYELTELVNVMPLRRVVLAVDRTTDLESLRATLHQAWNNMRPTSPNRAERNPVLHMCQLDRGASEVWHVLHGLSEAAAA